ncbi:MAG TPA: hypothetical protein VNS46_15755 [Nocardioides sp.]|nr:hypothetical protein [Nocardioides sp.]
MGAWVLKTAPGSTPVGALAAASLRGLTSRCVRRSYRTALMEPGQAVLLWVSGRDPHTPAGIHARGRITGVPEPTSDDDPRRLEVALQLEPVDPPVLRADLLADPVLSRIEVIRMPAGSNPSYLTREELACLRELLTVVDD